jgi:tetratricopeptide (TPR) repeat protein
LRQFPLSPLRVHALGVLTQSAWEQRRYRVAADFAQRTRAELRAQGPAREGEAALALLEAEAWFRAGLASGDRADYRGAAAAYAAVVRARTAEIPAERWGGLMLQRILAEIRAGSGEAGRVLDELAADAAFDAENRWRAEWSLARALLPEGAAGVREAYGRVNRLLSVAPPAGLPGELRARMAWLQARLAFDSGELERAVELSGALLVAPELPAALRTELTSTAALLRGRAEFALGREPAALETLRRLRAEHPGSEAAASSFLTEAEHFADQDKIDEARNRLISLTDNPAYRTSDYVPFALFRLATLAERLGRPENLQEANKRIEELVASAAAALQPDLVFAARLRQGNIFRKLNDFPAAQRAYEDLVNRYPRRPDVVLAQLALADTHSAQSSAADTTHADAAQLLFEQLRDRVDAPRDVRVEAGHKLGLLLARRGRVEEAIAVWWRDVIQPNLREEAGPFEPGATRPYWLARTLRELGEALERLGRMDEARRAYELLLDQRLPAGESIARARLEQLGGGARR